MMTFALVFLLSAAASAQATQPRTAINTSVVIKVADRDKTADTLIAGAEKAGGYLATRTDDQVTLKIPVAGAQAYLARLEPLGTMVERHYHAEDKGARLEELRTLLRSRQQVFQQYFAVLSTASANAVVEVEGQMTALVQEIEDLRGQIRLIEHQLDYAAITVRFQFRDRRAPAPNGNSSFAWLNTINIADLLADFAHAR